MDAGIRFYHGMPRSGKTLLMMAEAVNDYSNGRVIMSNFWMAIPHERVRLSDLLQKLTSFSETKPTSLFLDEIQTEADSYNFRGQDERYFTYFASQCGKTDTVVHYSSQFLKGAVARLREITTEVMRCEPIRDRTIKDLQKNLLGVHYSLIDAQTAIKKAEATIPVDALRPFFKMYDTKQRILPEGLQLQ